MPERILGGALTQLPCLCDLDEVRQDAPIANVDMDQELMFCQKGVQRVLLSEDEFPHDLEHLLIGALTGAFGWDRHLFGLVSFVPFGHPLGRVFVLLVAVAKAKLLELSRIENVLPDGGCLIHVQFSHLL